MAVALEDEQMQVQDFLEQQRLLEEERLRREEAARLLAEQQALTAQQQMQAISPAETLPPIPKGGNYMSQPQWEIDALQAHFNQLAQPTAYTPPVPRRIGDEQYMNELARAQRGSGFINAEVSPTGEVISAGYDPLKDFAALKAQQEATNLQRNQYVDSLVQGGATYAEAYRAGQGRYPQARNDAMRLRVEQLAQKTQPRALMQPEVVTVDGVKVMRTGPNSFARVPEPRTSLAARTVPPDTAASQKVITGQIAETRKDLERAKKEVENDPGNVDAARRGNIYQQRLTELEKALVTGSTNWMGAAQAPMPAAAPAQEVVRLVKGRRALFDPQTKAFIRYVD